VEYKFYSLLTLRYLPFEVFLTEYNANDKMYKLQVESGYGLSEEQSFAGFATKYSSH
jgi:hypothetical protein